MYTYITKLFVCISPCRYDHDYNSLSLSCNDLLDNSRSVAKYVSKPYNLSYV